MAQNYFIPAGFGHFSMDGGQHVLYCHGCVAEVAEYGWSIAGTDMDFLIKAAAAHIPYCAAAAPEMVKEELRHIGGGSNR